MLGDINKSLKPIEYQLVLCKPDKTQIGILNADNISYIARFPTTDELIFTINFNDNYYDLVKGDYLILLNDEKYFIIDYTEEIGDSKEIKNTYCFSLEYMLNRKKVRRYNLISRKLWSATNELDTNGYQLGVMNYVTTLTSWTLDTVSFLAFPNYNSTYRKFDISEKTLFDFLINDIQKSFNCIFIFDTVNRVISIKTISQLQGNKGLFISEDNYIKTINKKINNNEIKTRLYCYGDNISINDISLSGKPYIDNLTFYKTTEYMSQGLINALNTYGLALTNNQEIFTQYLADLAVLQEQLTTLNNNLNDAKTDLIIAQDNLDIAIKNSQLLTVYNTAVTNATLLVSTKQDLVNLKQTEIDAKYLQISGLQVLVDISNYLTSEQLIALDDFIKEETWNDTNYISSSDLLTEGVNKLSKLSTPPLLFDIEIIDFLNIIECQHDWNKLVLGDIVSVKFSKFNIDIDVRLIGYTHEPKNNNLTLSFSNKDSIDDPAIYLKDLMNNAITSGVAMNLSKSDWDAEKGSKSAITELKNADIDTTLKKILAGKNQNIITDNRGLWLTEKDINGNTLPEQMRIIANAIVLSDDGFATAKTAVTPQGINSTTFFGKNIIANNGLFDGIEVLDSDNNSIVEIGKYMNGETEKRGIKINGGSFEVVGGIPESQINSTSVSTWNSAESNANAYANQTFSTIATRNTDYNYLLGLIDGSVSTWFYDYTPIYTTVVTTSTTLDTVIYLDNVLGLTDGMSVSFIPKAIGEESDGNDLTTKIIAINGVNQTNKTITLTTEIGLILTANQVIIYNTPSSNWNTTAIRNNHVGDVFYNNLTGYGYRFALSSSTNLYSWLLITDSAITEALQTANNALDIATDHKRRVFIATPTVPYDIGDLWSQGISGDLMRCKFSKDSGGIYALNDWENASKYTDDTNLNTYVNVTFPTTIQPQIDGKIESWFQSVDPNTWLEIDRIKHNGDMWYNTSTKLLKRYNNITNTWELIEDQKAIDAYTNAETAQITADGKKTVFVITPITPYYVGDLWDDGITSNLKICTTERLTGVYDADDWGYTTVSQQFIDLASDSKLTPSEKLLIKKEWESIKLEKPQIDAQASLYTLSTDNTVAVQMNTWLSQSITKAQPFWDYTDDGLYDIGDSISWANATALIIYDKAYDWLNKYVTTYLLLDNGLTTNLPSDPANTASTPSLNTPGEVFRKSFADYYWAKANLLGAITNNINSTLADFASDNKLTPDEKQSILKEWNIIVSEKVLLDTQSTVYGITSSIEKIKYNSAYNDLNIYITPLIANLITTSDIVGISFRQKFKDYYDRKTSLLNKFSDVIKLVADNSIQKSILYNGVKIDSINGLVVQKTNAIDTLTNQTILNATDGIKIQRNIGTFTSPVWVDKFYVDTDGVLNLVDIIASGQIEASTLKATTQLLVNNIDINDLITNGINTLTGVINGATIQANTISASQIKTSELIVGTNVSMGENAYISWNNVINQPSIPSQYTNTQALAAWEASGYKTYIDANGVYSPTMIANAITTQNLSTMTITGALNTQDKIQIGVANAYGTCHINTATDGLRLQSHRGGSYLKVADSGGLEVYYNDSLIAQILPTGAYSGGGTSYIAKFA